MIVLFDTLLKVSPFEEENKQKEEEEKMKKEEENAVSKHVFAEIKWVVVSIFVEIRQEGSVSL